MVCRKSKLSRLSVTLQSGRFLSDFRVKPRRLQVNNAAELLARAFLWGWFEPCHGPARLCKLPAPSSRTQMARHMSPMRSGEALQNILSNDSSIFMFPAFPLRIFLRTPCNALGGWGYGQTLLAQLCCVLMPAKGLFKRGTPKGTVLSQRTPLGPDF